MILVLFVLWTIAVVAAVWFAQKRQYRKRNDRLLTHAQLSAIRTLSHHRHDWMNELQILYGYLRLNKLDKAVAVVDRIRIRMDHDSKLSQIGIPELATFLLSFRTICDTMRLDVDIQEGLHLDRLPYNNEKLSRAIIGMVNVFRVRAISPVGAENVLKLVLSHSELGLKLELIYEGELAAVDSVAAELAKCLNDVGRLDSEDEPTEKTQDVRKMVIHFPLPA
jgi:stage 0 sporulation protein B (sporulation initiation phosphotransferase)